MGIYPMLHIKQDNDTTNFQPERSLSGIKKIISINDNGKYANDDGTFR